MDFWANSLWCHEHRVYMVWLANHYGGGEMESGAYEAPGAIEPEGAGAGQKGLKTGALGYISNLVIRAPPPAPGYSRAATLGFVVAVAGMGAHAPAILIVSFIPMLLIAAGYYYMNR